MIFVGRLVLYIILMVLPAFHPAVSQYIDASFLLRAFLFVPLAAWLAWKQPEKGKGRLYLHIAVLLVPLLSLPLFGFSRTLLELFLSVQFAYWSTWFMFRRRFVRIFYIDAAYFVFVLYRLLSIHSAEAQVFNALALLIMFLGFLTYAILVYRLEFATRRPKTGELLVTISAPIVLALVIVFLLPANFVQELRSLNNLSNIINPSLDPLPDSSNSLEENGNLSGTGADGSGDEAQVFTMSPEAWSSRAGNGEGTASGSDGRDGNPQNQYMVMIVNSPVQTLYLADEYFNYLDEERGFYSDPTFELNQLTQSQYLETWQNPNPLPLRNRRPVWVDVYSTIPEKVSSYQPWQIEPTVFDTSYYPLSYTYRARSLVSNISILRSSPNVGELLSTEREELEPYLDIDLPTPLEQDYRGIISEIIGEGASYMERIAAILQYYRTYQYELGFTDNVSVAAITSFLFNSKAGDCTEFSNSAAILGRLAGIPTRVVTGYLVSKNLQTPAHGRALNELQNRYPPIAEHDPASLYLVTTAHRHSWAQFYLPVYGWVDFETTSYAIPPAGDMNPNNLDVVIPDLYESGLLQQGLPIPWGILFQFIAFALVLGGFLFYALRWSRIIRLLMLSRTNNEAGYKALYRLLIIRLHARGYVLKGMDLTPKDYAQSYPELGEFARLYSRQVFGRGGGMSGGGGESNPEELRREYRRLLGLRRSASVFFKEIFSLRDMRYL